MDVVAHPAADPELVEIGCALPGCRWRICLPSDMPAAEVFGFLARARWRLDPETTGYICRCHGDPENRCDA